VEYVDIPEADFRLLCGCPENVVKNLMKAGAIAPVHKAGARYETGPNAILLSECPILSGRFANAAEFPVLQMLYRQGMMIPGHPNNSGRKPMLIGLREQLEAQARYIGLGNYGLSSVEELLAAGLEPAEAEARWRIKLSFAFGAIRDTESLLDLRVIDAQAVELRDGVFLHRLGPNRYSVIYKGESVEVALGSTSKGAPARHQPPYALPRAPARPADFAVIHLGEGDGWDPGRPCMCSIVVHRGEYWLVDAGPDIEASLEAVGLGLSDIRGVFHTHIHDDHFIGFAALFRAPHRLAYCAVPSVRAGAAAKLSALAGIGEAEFCRYFDVHDLEEGRWNAAPGAGGLEVMPVFSPHPVETSLFRFRAFGRTYAHWADLSSFKVLDSMATDDSSRPGMSKERITRVKADYLEPADLKKLDVGGGMIHGDADDFSRDASAELFLSHTDSEGAVVRTFGRTASFGEETIFAPLSGGTAAPAPRALPARVFKAMREALVFRYGLPPEVFADLAEEASEGLVAEGELLELAYPGTLLVLESGRAELFAGGERLEAIEAEGVYGEERIICPQARLFSARALTPLKVFIIKEKSVERTPMVLWRLKELHERRLAAARSVFRLAWRPEYAVGIESIDAAHRGIIERIAALQRAASAGEPASALMPRLRELEESTVAHYADEESRMAAAGYPGLREHARIHQSTLVAWREYSDRIRSGECDVQGFIESLKDEILQHSLLVDRKYMPWLSKGT
jgi:hemerythrin